MVRRAGAAPPRPPVFLPAAALARAAGAALGGLGCGAGVAEPLFRRALLGGPPPESPVTSARFALLPPPALAAAGETLLGAWRCGQQRRPLVNGAS